MVRQLRRRAGMPTRRMQARTAPLPVYQRVPGRSGHVSALELDAEVDTASVAVPAVAPVMLTGLVEPKLRVGVSCAPLGLEVMAAVRATLPVKPPLGVTVIVEVFPVVAPGLTDTAVPATVTPGAAVTVTELVPVAAL